MKCARISSLPSTMLDARGLDPARGAPRGAAPVRRHRSNERSPSRRSQRPVDRKPDQGRALRPGIAAARTALRDHRDRRAGTRHRRQHRDLQPRRRGAAEAASLPQPRADCPHVGEAAHRDQFDDGPQLHRDEAPAAHVRSVLGGSRCQRDGGDRRRTGAAAGPESLRQPLCRVRDRADAGAHLPRGRGSAGRGKRARDQSRGVATALRRRSQHSRPRSSARWRAVPRDRRDASGRARSRSPARTHGLRQLLEAAGPDRRTARSRLAFSESHRPAEAGRLDRRRRSATCSRPARRFRT